MRSVNFIRYVIGNILSVCAGHLMEGLIHQTSDLAVSFPSRLFASNWKAARKLMTDGTSADVSAPSTAVQVATSLNKYH